MTENLGREAFCYQTGLPVSMRRRFKCSWGEANFLEVEPIHSQKRRRFNVTNSYIRGDSPRATTPRRFPPPLGQSRHGPSWGQTLQKSTETLNYWLIHHRAVLHNYRQVTAPLKYWWCKKKKNKNHFASSVKPDGIGTVILTLSVVSTRRLQYLASAMSQNKYIILSRVWNYQNVKVLKKLSHVKKIKKDGFFFFNNSIQNLQMMGPAHLEISDYAVEL